jgi:hypothetical protein
MKPYVRWEELKQVARDAKNDVVNRGMIEPVTPSHRGPATDPAPGIDRVSKKQIQTANALTMPVKSNGGLDLRHANKREPNGAEFLFITRRILAHWARWPGQSTENDPSWVLDLATLYVALTHFVNDENEPLFNAIPHFMVIAEKGSGKTRAMKVMRSLVRDSTIIASRYTMPGIRDALHAGKTPFLDEAQRAFGRGTANQAIQSILASSYSADSGTLDGIGGLNEREAFGSMILAAQPKIVTNTNDNLDDLFERSVMVEWEKSFDDIPELDNQFLTLTEAFRNVLSVWGLSQSPRPTRENKKPKLFAIHSMPDELSARSAEIANPLLAVADRAQNPEIAANDPTGYDYRWAITAREAVVQAFKGHGSDPSTVVSDVKSQLEAMGLKIGDE